MRDTNEEYFGDYDGLQHAKHSILRYYLDAWFPILTLTSRNKRVLYIDCNAGMGRHKTGEEGSPIIALRCLLDHPFCGRIIAKAEVSFLFFERKKSNANALQAEIAALGQLPEGIHPTLIHDDYERNLSEALDSLEEKGGKLAPAFAFVDPYNYSISMDLLNRLLSFNKCELFINFMYRAINLAIRNPHKEAYATRLNSLFGTTEWCRLQDIEASGERLSETVQLFSDQLSARYVNPPVMMCGAKNAVKYILLHATNNRKGLEKMKEAIWRAIPDGSFTAYERDYGQPKFDIGPNISPLKSIIWERFRGRKVRLGTKETDDIALDTPYLPQHVRKILKDYWKREIVTVTGYGKTFGFKNNPLFEFPDKRS